MKIEIPEACSAKQTKIVALVFYLVFCLAAAGCGSKDVEDKATSTTNPAPNSSVAKLDSPGATKTNAALPVTGEKIKNEKENSPSPATRNPKGDSDLAQEVKNHPPPLPLVPTYKTGKEQMEKIIYSNLKYPEEARKNKIEGTVGIVLKISDKGTIKNIRVHSKLGYGCDEEAVRLAKLLTEWSPGRIGSKNTEMDIGISIEFKLK